MASLIYPAKTRWPCVAGLGSTSSFIQQKNNRTQLRCLSPPVGLGLVYSPNSLVGDSSTIEFTADSHGELESDMVAASGCSYGVGFLRNKTCVNQFTNYRKMGCRMSSSLILTIIELLRMGWGKNTLLIPSFNETTHRDIATDVLSLHQIPGAFNKNSSLYLRLHYFNTL